VSETGSNHTVRRTITTHGLPSGDEFLIRALIRFLDGRACESWAFVDSNDADVVIVDGDSRGPPSAAADGATLIQSTTDTTRKGDRVLHRPVRSREFLELLNRISTGLPDASPADTTPASPVPPVATRPRADPPQTTKGVISRIRSRLGLAT